MQIDVIASRSLADTYGLKAPYKSLNLVTRLRGGSPQRKGLASPSPRQQELRDELAKLEFRKEEAIKGEDYDQAKAIKAEMDEPEAQLAACQPTEGSPKRLKSPRPSTIHHELRDELATLRLHL